MPNEEDDSWRTEEVPAPDAEALLRGGPPPNPCLECLATVQATLSPLSCPCHGVHLSTKLDTADEWDKPGCLNAFPGHPSH